MGSIGAPEILVILLVALLVLGPERLPDAARKAGRVMAEVRRMSSGFQAEMRSAMQQPVSGSPAGKAVSSDGGTNPATGAGGSNGSAQTRISWNDLPPSGGPGEPPASGA